MRLEILITECEGCSFEIDLNNYSLDEKVRCPMCEQIVWYGWELEY